MSAKTFHAMGDSPNKIGAIAAPDTDHRPTRWVMLRGRLEGVLTPHLECTGRRFSGETVTAPYAGPPP